VTFPPRHAISRARLFLGKASSCSVDERDDFEAFMEAAIVFARAALHRAQARHKQHPEWSAWWNSIEDDPAVRFFRTERDWLLKEAPPRVGQVVRLGAGAGLRAEDLYYFESPSTPATQTIRRHLDSFEATLVDAEHRFAARTGEST